MGGTHYLSGEIAEEMTPRGDNALVTPGLELSRLTGTSCGAELPDTT